MSVFRNLFLQFAERVFHLRPEYASTTAAYRYHLADAADSADFIFQARVLAFAPATWKAHSSNLRQFQAFCEQREVNPFEMTPYLLNVFFLHLAQSGASLGVVTNVRLAISFMFRFFLTTDFCDNPLVHDVFRFIRKVTPLVTNKKAAFGSAEIRRLWAHIEEKGGPEKLSLCDLRTFTLAVVQHATFARFSDIASVRISDVLHETDYFKIHVKYSKTDQNGHGQFLYIPKINSFGRDPHMLMCVYIHRTTEGIDVTDEYLFPPLF